MIVENAVIECPRCGGTSADVQIDQFVGANGKDVTRKIAFCKTCGKLLLNETNWGEVVPGTVTCPYCSSTNCKKISGASKVGKVLMWGVLAAGSVGHAWHCNSCGSNFG